MLHTMQLVDFAFEAIAKGEKTYELRLRDEKRRRIRVGDRICFCRKDSPDQVVACVQGLFAFEDFEKLYATLPLERCGYSKETLPTAHPRDMERFYSAEEIKKWGVLAIEIQRENADTALHYDRLLEQGDDPVWDGPVLKAYMERWDGDDFFALMAPQSTQRALEIGVGSGRLAMRSAPLWGELYGIDLSLPTVERARKNLGAFSNVRLICGDFLSYEFPCLFDCIYSSLTLLHLKQKEEAVNKAAGLLKKGGRLLLSLDKNQEETLVSPTGMLKTYPDDPDEIVRLAQSAGLTLVTRQATEAAVLLLLKKK